MTFMGIRTPQDTAEMVVKLEGANDDQHDEVSDDTSASLTAICTSAKIGGRPRHPDPFLQACLVLSLSEEGLSMRRDRHRSLVVVSLLSSTYTWEHKSSCFSAGVR